MMSLTRCCLNSSRKRTMIRTVTSLFVHTPFDPAVKARESYLKENANPDAAFRVKKGTPHTVALVRDPAEEFRRCNKNVVSHCIESRNQHVLQHRGFCWPHSVRACCRDQDRSWREGDGHQSICAAPSEPLCHGGSVDDPYQ